MIKVQSQSNIELLERQVQSLFNTTLSGVLVKDHQGVRRQRFALHKGRQGIECLLQLNDAFDRANRLVHLSKICVQSVEVRLPTRGYFGESFAAGAEQNAASQGHE